MTVFSVSITVGGHSQYMTQKSHSHNIPFVNDNMPEVNEEPQNNTYKNCGHTGIISKTTEMKIHN